MCSYGSFFVRGLTELKNNGIGQYEDNRNFFHIGLF